MKHMLGICCALMAEAYAFSLSEKEETSSLLLDLQKVHQVDKEIVDSLPLFYNVSLMGGYYTMPSARMNQAGVVALGAGLPPPYTIYGLNVQPFDRLELSLNYLVYNGILEPGFGKEGFGDDAERMGNLKFGVLTPSEDLPFLPLISVGAQDFLGTKRFNAQYVVATKEWKEANLELTLGWGHGRMRGWFGGGAWSPLRHSSSFWKSLTLQVEYDANDYAHHHGEHAKGREVKSKWNVGLSLLPVDYLQLSLSSLRGSTIAASASLRYPLGSTQGFFPKVDDPKPYRSPIDIEPLGELRPEKAFAGELAHAFSEQGLDLYLVLCQVKGSEKFLWLKVINNRYLDQYVVKDRLQHLLSALVPSDVEKVFVVVEATGLACQQYEFRVQDLYDYRKGRIGSFELGALSPAKEVVSFPSEYEGVLLFKRSQPIWTWTLRPRLVSFFGNTAGKFKCNLGATLSPEGYLFDRYYYKAQLSYSALSTTAGMNGVDRLNPSHLFTVRSDSMKYYQNNTAHLEQAFLQRSWNLGKGFFSRISAGYFEIAYAGASAETLWYPVNSSFAMGLEFASVWKRQYSGIRFFHKVKKFDGTHELYLPFTGYQAFLTLHYTFAPLSMDFKITAGQFLARDKGARFEVGRYFQNGLRFSVWYSLTNANEELNGHRYHDKGFAFLIPLEFFMKKSSKSYVGYAMSAWLRDQAAQADTGKKLYSILSEERFSP